MPRPEQAALLIATGVLLAGCVTVLATIPPEPRLHRYYEIGQPQRASIGEPIFDAESATTRQAFYTIRGFDSGRIRITEGTRFEVISQLVEDGTFVVWNEEVSEVVLLRWTVRGRS